MDFLSLTQQKYLQAMLFRELTSKEKIHVSTYSLEGFRVVDDKT